MLEQLLVGLSLDEDALRERIYSCFNGLGVRVTGASIDAFVHAILVAKEVGLA